MVGMFGDCALHGLPTLDKAVASGQVVDMENYFSRLALDIIGKAVFNYDFDSLTHDDPVISVRGCAHARMHSCVHGHSATFLLHCLQRARMGRCGLACRARR